MLTKKQNELLRFINERLKEDGVPPSFDEMKEALDLRSKSGIHRLIMALEERGFIRRLPNRARALEVLEAANGTKAALEAKAAELAALKAKHDEAAKAVGLIRGVEVDIAAKLEATLGCFQCNLRHVSLRWVQALPGALQLHRVVCRTQYLQCQAAGDAGPCHL